MCKALELLRCGIPFRFAVGVSAGAKYAESHQELRDVSGRDEESDANRKLTTNDNRTWGQERSRSEHN